LGPVALQVRASKPTSSTSMRTNCGARRPSARTRISIGAIGRRRRNCTATTASRLIGAASEVCVPHARRGTRTLSIFSPHPRPAPAAASGRWVPTLSPDLRST
jgi:hypothetical protein